MFRGRAIGWRDGGLHVGSGLACEQALGDAWTAGWEKEGELATTSLEFEYLHRKSRCEMLTGGDDISNDVITLATCFFNVCLRSRSFPLHADWRKSDSSVDREPQGNWSWNSNSRYVVVSSPSFSRRTARAPRRACSQAPLSRLSFSKEFLFYVTVSCKGPMGQEVRVSMSHAPR